MYRECQVGRTKSLCLDLLSRVICRAMAFLLRLCLVFGIVLQTLAQNHVPFDRATASSVYSSGSYSAGQALTAGSGYWCRYEKRARHELVVFVFCYIVLAVIHPHKVSPGRGFWMSDVLLQVSS